MQTPPQNFVAYCRVATKKQGQSGLGPDAQRSSVIDFVRDQTQLIGELCDIESGKNDQRPELLKAVQFAKQHNARLVIAKLDQLNVCVVLGEFPRQFRLRRHARCQRVHHSHLCRPGPAGAQDDQ